MSDPYVDPDTGLLRNRLGITEPAQLERAEAYFAYHAEVDVYASGVSYRRYDLAVLQAVHRRLFGEVYPWAGELRTVNIAKGATAFAATQHLRRAGEQTFDQLDRNNQFHGLDRAGFAAGAGRLLGDLNALHPFREGNGRAQRVLVQLIARDAGWQLRWAKVDKAENDAISEAAMVDPDAFEPLLHRILVPTSVALPLTDLRLPRGDPPGLGL